MKLNDFLKYKNDCPDDLVARRIIKTYMRYVLITATKHVETKAEAAYIVLYAFASTYTIMNEPAMKDQVGLILDTMIDVVGDDVITNPEAKKQAQEYGLTGLLLKDKTACKIAKALNALDGFYRQVLVLHFIENMSSKDISGLYPGRWVSEIDMAIILASKLFVEQLAELLPRDTILLFDDVGKWLNRLRDCLDLYVMQATGKAALGYLDGIASEDWELRYKIETKTKDWKHDLN